LAKKQKKTEVQDCLKSASQLKMRNDETNMMAEVQATVPSTFTLASFGLDLDFDWDLRLKMKMKIKASCILIGRRLFCFSGERRLNLNLN
jgi:hypothetical protein